MRRSPRCDPDCRNPLIALVVSDEAATYRPEMEWLAEQLQLQGKRVFCLRPEDMFPLGGALFFDADGNPEKIDVIYRFFELFDLANIRTAAVYLRGLGSAARSRSRRRCGLFRRRNSRSRFSTITCLQDYWAEALSGRALKLLRQSDSAILGDGSGAAASRRGAGRTARRRPGAHRLARL